MSEVRFKVHSPHLKGDSMKPPTLRVAFATKDLEQINAHFGGAEQFAIYDVNTEGYCLVEVLKTSLESYEGDAKTEAKIAALKDIAVLYCESIGGTAAAKVVKNRIHPIKVMEPKSIQSECDRLVMMLQTNPPPFIQRIMQTQNEEISPNQGVSDE